jgi:DNA-binding response OmpR family regulator
VSFEELLAPMRALKRRVTRPRPTDARAGELRLDPADHRALRGEADPPRAQRSLY